MAEQELKHIVRVANTDLDGATPVGLALKKVKGISFAVASSICAVSGIDKDKKAGYLSDKELSIISDILKNPEKHGLPAWMLNRRKDCETGTNKHKVGVELNLAREQDVKRLIKIKSYRGLRLAWHLPVRGQRTRSNFRPNKGRVVGVKRRKGVRSGRV